MVLGSPFILLGNRGSQPIYGVFKPKFLLIQGLRNSSFMYEGLEVSPVLLVMRPAMPPEKLKSHRNTTEAGVPALQKHPRS